MMTLYGLTECEWLILAFVAGLGELNKPLLEIKALYHHAGASNSTERSEAEIDKIKNYMLVKLQHELISIGDFGAKNAI